MKKIFYWVLGLILMISQSTFGQKSEHNGWLFLSHQQKLGDKWQLSSDFQIRSADKLSYLNTLLIRPGIGYKISDDQTVTVGYTFFGRWMKENSETTYQPEHRIFEQYQLENKIARIEITNRVRYEQRFIRKDESIFAQRFRYYIQAQIPLIADSDFKTGFYTAIQDEIFLNVQGKDKLNNHVYDQNRTYISLGYRFGENLEIEAGYMFRYIIEQDQNVRNNILQIFIKTSL